MSEFGLHVSRDMAPQKCLAFVRRCGRRTAQLLHPHSAWSQRRSQAAGALVGRTHALVKFCRRRRRREEWLKPSDKHAPFLSVRASILYRPDLSTGASSRSRVPP